MFSRRTDWSLEPNRLALALERRRREGARVLDLTISNPTQAGIDYPAREIAEALASADAHVYAPRPGGSRAAREAIAGEYAARGLAVRADQVLLTASTSESYSWLFKMLCDPGDGVLAPRPSYPLFEFLAGLESVAIEPYRLVYDGRWEIDLEALERAISRAPQEGPPGRRVLRASRTSLAPLEPRRPPRAVIIVNPNNPTGSYLGREALDTLSRAGRGDDLPLISDEVFATFPLDAPDPAAGARGSALRLAGRCTAESSAPPGRVASLLGRPDIPAFVLDGLSKSAGLPGMKCGWIIVQGPEPFRKKARERLELIADTYLSLSAPVERALPRLIAIGRSVAQAIRVRTRTNLALLARLAPAGSACELLRAEGGWSAILRVPRTLSEEEWCLRLLNGDGVLVQPGWFFDFESEAYLVVSLLPSEPVFAEGVARILATVLRDDINPRAPGS